MLLSLLSSIWGHMLHPDLHRFSLFDIKIIEEFFNHTWRARHNQSMPDHSLTLLWSLSVSIKDFGALLGSLGVKYLADSYGRSEEQKTNLERFSDCL